MQRKKRALYCKASVHRQKTFWYCWPRHIVGWPSCDGARRALESKGRVAKTEAESGQLMARDKDKRACDRMSLGNSM
jgi:hypothetical protein